MTFDELLHKFGLPSSAHHRDELRLLLAEEIERERRGEGADEVLRTLCSQLFSLGVVEDALLIWEAKESSFDAFCGLDVQFLCGAGLGVTKEYLAKSKTASAAAALNYLIECESAGDFVDWTPEKTLSDYREYFGLN